MLYVPVNILAYNSSEMVIQTKDTVFTFMSKEWQLAKNNIAVATVGSKSVILFLLDHFCCCPHCV